MKKQVTFFNVLWAALIAFAFVAAPAVSPVAQAQTDTGSPSSICLVSAPNTQAFPEVKVDFRALDGRLNAVSTLSKEGVQIRENDKTLQPSSVNVNSNGTGLNLYFVLDQGNRTSQSVARDVLRRFGENFMTEGLDRVTIVTNLKDSKRQNPSNLLAATTSVSQLIGAVSNLPDYPTNEFLGADSAILEAYSQIRNDAFGCGRASMVVAVMGPDEVTDPNLISQITKAALQAKAPLYIVHIGKNSSFGGEDDYRSLAESTFGLYVQARPETTQQFTSLDQPLFTPLVKQRLSYSLTYRSSDATSGNHTFGLFLSGQNAPQPEGSQNFSVALAAPVVTISSPAPDTQVIRTAKQQVGANFVYDKDTEVIQFNVQWADNFPRDIVSAEFVIATPAETKTVATLSNPGSGALEFEWDMKDVKAEGDNPITIQVRVKDELGFVGQSQPMNIKIQNVIPAGVIESKPSKITQYQLYILYGVVALLLVMIFLLRRQLGKLASSGAVGKLVNEVRKTLVGGTHRGKAMASLKVLDGPASMVNQDLKVFTETVKLGRDPNKADLTFYTPDSKTSISGLHCKIERVNGSWRIVALSQSGSETFVDDRPIPFNEPYPISSGQKVRMGYLAQQPVEFIFTVDETTSRTTQTDPRKTDVAADTVGMKPRVAIGGRDHRKVAETPAAEDADSIFDEFRSKK